MGHSWINMAPQNVSIGNFHSSCCQWSFLVPLIGGGWCRITQLVIYKSYISPTTYWGNHNHWCCSKVFKPVPSFPPSSPSRSTMETTDFAAEPRSEHKILYSIGWVSKFTGNILGTEKQNHLATRNMLLPWRVYCQPNWWLDHGHLIG